MKFLKTYFSLCVFALLLVACGNDTQKAAEETDTTATKVEEKKPSEKPETEKAATPKVIYVYDKADLHELLKLSQLNESTVQYELSFTSGDCKETVIKGNATLKEGDAESDDDGNGNAYFVNEYTDESNGICGVSLRIGVEEDANKARFILFNCKKMACGDSYESQKMTRKD